MMGRINWDDWGWLIIWLPAIALIGALIGVVNR